MEDLSRLERNLRWLWSRRTWVLIALPAVAAGLALWGVCELFDGFKPFAERAWNVMAWKLALGLLLGLVASYMWFKSSRKREHAFAELQAQADRTLAEHKAHAERAFGALQNELAEKQREDEGLINTCFVTVVRAILNSDCTLSIQVKLRNNSGHGVTIHGLRVDQLRVNKEKNVTVPQILLGTPDEFYLPPTHARPAHLQGTVSVPSDVPLDRAFDINIAASATIHRAKWSRLYFQMHDVQLEDSESIKIRKQEQAAE